MRCFEHQYAEAAQAGQTGDSRSDHSAANDDEVVVHRKILPDPSRAQYILIPESASTGAIVARWRRDRGR